MNTQHHPRTHERQANIPLLDRRFDAKSPEIDDFILSHSQALNEDSYIMGFNEIPDRYSHEPRRR